MADVGVTEFVPPVAADEHRGLVQVVHDHLRARILAGDFAPGEALRQEQIASDLRVSRAPVREALLWLEREGIVALRPRRGFVVTSLDCEEIREIFDIRILLEEHAGYVATLRRTPADIADVERLLDALGSITGSGRDDMAKWAALNREFHERLFASSGRKHLVRMTGTLRDSVERYVRLDASFVGSTIEADVEHREIFEAFRARDAKTVGRLSREHCEHTCERLIASLKRQNG